MDALRGNTPLRKITLKNLLSFGPEVSAWILSLSTC